MRSKVTANVFFFFITYTEVIKNRMKCQRIKFKKTSSYMWQYQCNIIARTCRTNIENLVIYLFCFGSLGILIKQDYKYVLKLVNALLHLRINITS